MPSYLVCATFYHNVCLPAFITTWPFFSAPCAAQAILRRFRSNRTDHLKVRNIIQKTKSGAGASPQLTAKQLFKLNRYAFLDAYQRSRSSSSTLGQVKTHKHTHHFPSCSYTFAIHVQTFCSCPTNLPHLIACPQMPSRSRSPDIPPSQVAAGIDDDDDEPAASTPTSLQSMGRAGSRSSRKGSSSDIADVLDAFLCRAAKQDQEMQTRVRIWKISL